MLKREGVGPASPCPGLPIICRPWTVFWGSRTGATPCRSNSFSIRSPADDPDCRADAGGSVGCDGDLTSRGHPPIPRETGSATVLSDLVLRGAGSGQPDVDGLSGFVGLQRSSSVSVHHSRFACARWRRRFWNRSRRTRHYSKAHMPESGV